jgi:predicted secreted protein
MRPPRAGAHGRQAVAGLAALALLPLLASCGGRGLYWPVVPPDLPPPRVVGDAADGSTVSLVRTQWILVRLPADPASGYRWSYELSKDRALYPSGETPRFMAAPGAATGDQVFTFRAEAPGTTGVRFSYRNPDAPQMPAAKTIAFDVVSR